MPVECLRCVAFRVLGKGMGMTTVKAKIGQTETGGQTDALESLPQRRRVNNVTVLTYTANGIIVASLPSLAVMPETPSSPVLPDRLGQIWSR